MNIVEIIEMCRAHLADFPDPRFYLRTVEGKSKSFDYRSAYEFLSKLEFDNRDEIDRMLQDGILDLREQELSSTQQFLVRTRLQGAIYNLTLLVQTLNPDEELHHATCHRSYSFEWAIVRYWNACRWPFLDRVARAFAAGVDDPLQKIPVDEPPWVASDKRR